MGAAGLKHVALPEFENADGSAWAGSQKKTNKNRPVQEVEEENPWAGSLRHVDDHRKGKARKEEKEDTYGNAPWMGTLRYRTYRDIYIFFDQKKLTMNASQ